MRFWDYKIAGVAFLIFLGCAPGASLSQPKRNKTVWNYDGGVFFATDGSLPNGACFRVSGGMNAGDFFDRLKRVDDEHGTVFRRGPETVIQFPEVLAVSFAIRDLPCDPGLHDNGPRTYLTREMMGHLQLMVYWKQRKGSPDPRRADLSARHRSRGRIASALRVVLSAARPECRGASHGQSCIGVPDG